MTLPLAGRSIGLLTSSASRQGGGVFEALVAHTALINGLGGEAIVFALEDEDSARDRSRLGSSEVVHLQVRGPRQIGFAPGLFASLKRAKLDCLHLHGIWMYPSRAGYLWARETGRPYFISPHGMLDPWITARGRWKKALARAGYERAGWQAATRLHALTDWEAGNIAVESGRNDSLVIPNAGPMPATGAVAARANNLAYIGRIHPKKNLIELVRGWTMAHRPSDARLRIAGWGDKADVASLLGAIADSDGSVEFLGPVFGAAKAELIEQARFVILASHSEGLPMAMLEAWACATPTIMTSHCNLPEGFSAGAALPCGTGAPDIASAAEEALALDEVRWCEMANAALRLASTRFSPSAVAAQWATAYVDAIEKGSQS